MPHHKWGIHLPTDNEPIPGYGWDIIANCVPEAVVLMIGQGVSSGDIRRLVEMCPDLKAVICRWWTPPGASVQAVIDKHLEFITDPSWNDAIPEHMRVISPWNEVNKDDGGEGFGASVYQMQRFNAAMVDFCNQSRAANPTWEIMFPALTPGNRDAFFPGDDEGLHYYMHGPEAAKENPTDAEIAAAIQSCICGPALRACDVYGFHYYGVNDPDMENWSPYYGQRWQVFQKFFPPGKEDMPIYVKELGVGKEPHHLTDYLEYLRDYAPEVIATACYKMNDEPFNYWSGNPYTKHIADWRVSLGEPTEPEPPEPPQPPEPPEPPQPPENGGKTMRARVGVVGTNDHNWKPESHHAVQQMKLEAIGVMDYNNVADGVELLDFNPNMEFLVRLWSGGFGPGQKRETPQQFVDNTKVGLGVWVDLANGKDIYVQVHNEPNLEFEGWGTAFDQALSFSAWFCDVYDLYQQIYPKAGFPNVHFGFPGLSPHLNDLNWLVWCEAAIEKSDFLCVHCYGYRGENHLDPDLGLRYRHYLGAWGHKKRLYITEFNLGPYPWEMMAPNYIRWYEQVIADSQVDHGAGTPSILGALPFILSSHDDEWDPLMWVMRNGDFQPIIGAMANATWPPLFGEPEPPEPEPPDPPGADFHGEPREGYAPLEVLFSDWSTGEITSRLWDFGDGGESDERNPAHVYGVGQFDVTLRVEGPGGSSIAKETGFVKVEKRPMARSVKRNPTEPKLIDFRANGRVVLSLPLARCAVFQADFGCNIALPMDVADNLPEGMEKSVYPNNLFLDAEWAEALSNFLADPLYRPPINFDSRATTANVIVPVREAIKDEIYSRESLFPEYANEHGLGGAVTLPVDVPSAFGTWRAQGHLRGIIYAPLGNYDETTHMEW